MLHGSDSTASLNLEWLRAAGNNRLRERWIGVGDDGMDRNIEFAF
jgi:hypothetical protein